ncbi:urease accessory UreF family protein [Microbacterium sp.]|uniref:urease accessory protein UreF n=1 Tax=Microbacterium sp. TaxID=51671 RepID=UPI0028A81B7E|nr:urease accessory UreF family protein [Microbacterium sp.]
MSVRAALLLLADGRLPSGGYAHSGGLESAVRSGEVRDTATLKAFLHARATTVGLVAASYAAAAHRAAGSSTELDELDADLDARMPAAASRAVSRALGRQLTRVLRGIHPHPLLDELPPAAHQPLVYGVAAASLALTAADVAQLVVHENVAGPAAAAAKVLSIDPFAVHSILIDLAPLLDAVAAEAAEGATRARNELPSLGTPLLDILAEQHAHREVRLFAS